MTLNINIFYKNWSINYITWENLQTFFDECFPTAPLSELTTETFLKLFNVLYRNIAS